MSETDRQEVLEWTDVRSDGSRAQPIEDLVGGERGDVGNDARREGVPVDRPVAVAHSRRIDRDDDEPGGGEVARHAVRIADLR